MDESKLATVVLQGGRLRATLLELWQRTRMDWGFVTDRLSSTFRKETWIGAHERRFIGETLYGLLRHLRRIDAAIARGRTTKKTPQDMEWLIALFVLEKWITPAQAQQASRDLDWDAVGAIDEVIANERKLEKRIGLATSLPDWLVARLIEDWGDRAEPLAHALNQRAPMTVRANLLVGDRDALAAVLAEEKLATRPGLWCDTALHVDTRTNLFGSEAFKRGAMEAQDEGSQLLADLATANLHTDKPTVIDLCAGAGGKTLAIAGRLQNRGRIISTDVDAKKLEELRRRVRRAGITNAQALHLEEGVWPAALIGALRRNPEARWRLRHDDIASYAERQREILIAAARLLAPGGRLVYGTCTLLAAENHEVVEATKAARAELVDVPLAEVLGGRAPALGVDELSFTVAPDTHGTDGFYARVLRR